MKNRYDTILRVHNKEIISLVPSNQVLRLIAAFELKKYYTPGMRVLEIGCGEGDSAEYLLNYTDASIDLLDVSSEMIEICKKNLEKYKQRTQYICEDAAAFLQRSESYDVISSSWTIHNFIQEDKLKMFELIYQKLNPGGIMLIMDKIYPDSGGETLLARQLERNNFLDPLVAEAINTHEHQDMSPDYKMDESTIIKSLQTIGFKNIKICDRVERDVVLMAYK